jgi:hypothetical protein
MGERGVKVLKKLLMPFMDGPSDQLWCIDLIYTYLYSTLKKYP